MDAVVALLPAAEAVATPAASAAATVLDRYEAEARLRLASGPEDPSREDLNAAKAFAADEQAKLTALNVQIASLNEAIGALIRAQRKRQSWVWSRWLPKPASDTALERLRSQRDLLLEEHKRAERPMLSAVAAEARAQRKFAATIAAATAAHVKAMSEFRLRLTAIERARRILRLWPSFAYVGVRKLIATGGRMEKAKARGWDPETKLSRKM